MTCGPTMVKPVVKTMRKDRTRSPAVIQQGPEKIAGMDRSEDRRKRLDISSTSVSYKVQLSYHLLYLAFSKGLIVVAHAAVVR